MSTPNANNRTKRAAYSNGSIKSYDGLASSLGVRFYNEVGVIDIAPINPEFVGKQAQKGDKVYNYDDRISVFTTPEVAQGCLATIKQLQDLLEYALQDEEYVAPTRATYTWGERSFTILAPGAKLKINGERPDLSEKFVIMIAVPDEDGNVVNVTHILGNGDLTLTFPDKTKEEQILYVGLENLKAFFNEVIALGTGAYRQGAALAAPTGGAAKSASDKSKSFSTVLEDEDDFDEDNDAPAKSATKPSTTRKVLNPKSKAPVKADLDKEFDLDDE